MPASSSSSSHAPSDSDDPINICIECSHPVQSLYTAYSSADDRSLGRGVRLTQCPRCKRFADKYVEHDFVVLFIDMVLIKPQVYRHLLFNRLGKRSDAGVDKAILRLGILLLLFDVYLTWARIEKEAEVDATTGQPTTWILRQPMVLQYLFFLILCSMESVLFHLTIRLAARWMLGWRKPNAVSTALLISSCTKLFPILIVIWPNYDVPAAAKSVGWAVVVNNVEALRIQLGVDYVRAGLLAGVGAAVRAAFGGILLAWVGGRGGGGAQEIVGALKSVAAWKGLLGMT